MQFFFRCKGGDEFAKVSGALHCGVRRACTPFYSNDDGGEGRAMGSPVGVEIIEMEEEVDFKQLRYPSPDVSAYELEDYLSLEELDFIVDNMKMEYNKFEKYSTALSRLQMQNL